MRVVLAAVVACCVVACGEDDPAAPPADAGPPAPTVAGPAPPAPPAPVAQACPSGFATVPGREEGDGPTCDPYPPGGPSDCAVDEAHFPGEPACRRIGSECPSGDWSDDLPVDAPVLYVRAGEAPGGDGSKAMPFGTIAGAMSGAAPGTWIALAKGTYDEPVLYLGPEITVWGACVAETIVARTSGGLPTVETWEAQSRLGNLRIGGLGFGTLVKGGSAELTVEGVAVDDVGAAAFSVQSGGTLSGTDLVLRDVKGHGIEATDAQLTLGPAWIDSAREWAILGLNDATLDLERVAVVRTQAFGNKRGVAVGVNGAKVSFREGLVAGSEGDGFVFDHAEAEVADAVVRDLEWSDGAAAGVRVSGGSVDLARLTIEHTPEVGLAVLGGAVVVATDVVLRDIPASEDGGIGVAILEGDLRLERVLVENTAGFGVYSDDTATDSLRMLTLRDVTIRHVQTRFDGTLGVGIFAVTATNLTLERGLLYDCGFLALAIGLPGTVATLSDLEVSSTRSDAAGLGGRAIGIEVGAVVTADRVALHDNRECGLFVSGASLSARDVAITTTGERACAATTCPGFGGGVGLGSYEGALVDLTTFAISENTLAGVQLARGGRSTLTTGRVEAQPIGANVQDPNPDVLVDTDVIWDNIRDFDGALIATPEPTPPPTQ